MPIQTDMQSQDVSFWLFLAGIAFLAISVWHNRRTGWRPKPRRDDLLDFYLWCAQLKASVALDEPVPASPQATSPGSVESSLIALAASVGTDQPTADERPEITGASAAARNPVARS